MRVALGIEYDGSAFSGWQTQAHARTVQSELESALSKVAAQPITLVCAGRTDAGVHATAQVAHFDSEVERPMRGWVFGANANLTRDVAVRWAQPVDNDFHARFSACSRAYRYVILNRPARSGLWAHKVTWECRVLDAVAMAEAATPLLGEHDFTSFRAAGCQAKQPIRRLTKLTVERDGEFVLVDVKANGFLHHMVRNIVGCLLEVGRGERPTRWLHEVLTHRDRRLAGMTAPADGLYLVRVDYPPRWELPLPPPLPFA